MAYQPGLSGGISAKRDDLNPYCLMHVDYYSPEWPAAARGYSNRAGLSTERRYALHDGRFFLTWYSIRSILLGSPEFG